MTSGRNLSTTNEKRSCKPSSERRDSNPNQPNGLWMRPFAMEACRPGAQPLPLFFRQHPASFLKAVIVKRNSKLSTDSAGSSRDSADWDKVGMSNRNQIRITNAGSPDNQQADFIWKGVSLLSLHIHRSAGSGKTKGLPHQVVVRKLV